MHYKKDLATQIDNARKKDVEEKEKVKLRGGNRLKIEDTDGSSDGEIEEVDMKVELNAKSDELVKNANETKKIHVTEVETDEDDENNEEKEVAKKESAPLAEKEQISLKEERTQGTSSKMLDFVLPKTVIEFKDRANQHFTNGQYGDAAENYTQAIESLNKNILIAKSKFCFLCLKKI